jgi:hypothetical protein
MGVHCAIHRCQHRAERWVNVLQHVVGMQGIATTTKLRVCVLWNVVGAQGTAANTEPETVAVGNTILARRRNIRVYTTLHSYGEHQSRVRMHHPTLLIDPRNQAGKQNLPIVATSWDVRHSHRYIVPTIPQIFLLHSGVKVFITSCCNRRRFTTTFDHIYRIMSRDSDW